MRHSEQNWKSERSKIIKLLKQGVNPREIAKQYNCTYQNIYLVIEKLGIDRQSIKDAIRLDKHKKRIEAAWYARKMAWLNKYSYLTDEMIEPKGNRRDLTLPIDGVAKEVLAAREATKEYRERERLKVFSRNILRRAVKMGYVVRGVCKECGSLSRIEAHHSDYRKPFQVEWLCKEHHWERHTEGGN